MNNDSDVENSIRKAEFTVGFLLQPHFSLLAFTAAADALTTANLVIGKPRFSFQTLTLGAPRVVSDLSIMIPCDRALPRAKSYRGNSAKASDYRHAERSVNSVDALLSGIDLLLVCGGYRCKLQQNRHTSQVLQEAADKGIALGGLWNGVCSVAYAGLMEGFGCAMHTDNHDFARQQFPNMQVRTDTMVIDRDRLSAAGPNSAFDLILSVIQRQDCVTTVEQIRRILKADTSTDESVTVALQRDEEHLYPQNLRDALQFMRSNLTNPVDKQNVARHINKSPRAMERLFQRHINTSPSRYYLILRLQKAHELLASTNQSIEEISRACGFISGAHFSRAFTQRYGGAPSKLRKVVNQVLDT